MSNTDSVRNHLTGSAGPFSVPEIAAGCGLTNKQASDILRRLVKNGEAVKDGDLFKSAGVDYVTDEEISGEPEHGFASPEVMEDLIGDEEPLWYEFIDFPGNYSIVMAPFAVEIAEAAGVPAKVETFKGKLNRRVHLGGTDVEKAALAAKRIRVAAEGAMAHLHTWQKENVEKRRGLTDMQKYLQHREVLADYGHDVAATIKKSGL